ncbi:MULTISPECIES: type I pantothenate kinase [Alteribacter]|uniref:Pantothenate kinase n=1 Tax=Alteribacter keqinensis TaxID=2483800 RepID=A0A3M7TVI5_9BACI|nr:MULTISPECIES: type I pantothenate kinase [Alteribacter]MBM7094511.1 type I pantothenate kinase [Alteribacter salitolerans]RNA69271.1 type I pantothenate kinase [Alteribacter keqinensis]
MISNHPIHKQYSPYITLQKEEWASLSPGSVQPLSAKEIEALQGINENISLDEVSSVYLPLSRLINLYTTASQDLHSVTNLFLHKKTNKVPYVIGMAGSVAVGKSTTARLIQALLSRWPNHPKVELITTDGFLHPNRVLEERGIMNRKGFPESYDTAKLINFLADLKSGKEEVSAPVYSHLVYDIVEGEKQTVTQPDIVIVEGINVLQVANDGREIPEVFVSDFFDFSIYVDALEEDIFNWYIERFKTLRNTAFQNPQSYFKRYAGLSDEEATAIATKIWKDINEVNLYNNILPTKHRADLILRKGKHHSVEHIHLRKI